MAKLKSKVDDYGRVCLGCGKYLPWSEYHKLKVGARGYHPRCKECMSKISKKYNIDHKDEISIKNKKRYIDDREYLIKKQNDYYYDNKDKKKEYDNSPATYRDVVKDLTPFESPRKTKDGYLEVKCATCRDYFTPTNLQLTNRIGALVGRKRGECRLYCSDSCKASCSVYGRSKYPKGYNKKSEREYSTVYRNMILERDNYTCQHCGEKHDPENLQAHHKTPLACSPMEQLDIDSGECVCIPCHINIHKNVPGMTYTELAKANKINKQNIKP